MCTHLHFKNVSVCVFTSYQQIFNFIIHTVYVYIFAIHTYWMPQRKGNMKKMNKLLVALGLAATVALVGCNKDKAPETGATTGEHLEQAAEQAGADVKMMLLMLQQTM
jgi:hypothetical protein